MPIQKIKSGRVITVTSDEFIGNKGTIFYDEDTGQLKLSDGITPGGISISIKSSFETINKNLSGYPSTLSYTNGKLTSVIYNLNTGTITKNLTYTEDLLTSISLSGDLFPGLLLTKNLIYQDNRLIQTNYS